MKELDIIKWKPKRKFECIIPVSEVLSLLNASMISFKNVTNLIAKEIYSKKQVFKYI